MQHFQVSNTNHNTIDFMNHSLKKKLCWNCEGSVNLESETCPYCGVSVIPATLEGQEISPMSQTTRFTPSYSKTENDLFDNFIPASPYAFQQPVRNESHTKSYDETEELDREIKEQNKNFTNKNHETKEIESEEGFGKTVIATTFLLSGSVFFLFGLALMLFSHDGLLVLEWDANFWFIYLAAAFPMLFFGLRALSKLEKTN